MGLTSCRWITIAGTLTRRRCGAQSGEERLQLKWFTAAALVLAVPFRTATWVNSAAVIVLQPGVRVPWTAVAIAVLKYRLYDIDQIISRTLAYATVAAFAVRLKDTVDLHSVRGDLAAVIDRALAPAPVSVWISQPGLKQPTGQHSHRAVSGHRSNTAVRNRYGKCGWPARLAIGPVSNGYGTLARSRNSW
jgi:hypothetical protein